MFYIFYFLCLFWIALQDWKFHMIKLYTFYIFFALNIYFYYYLVSDWWYTSFLILVLATVFLMDLYEAFVWEIKTIGKYWRIWWMWVYDLLLYLIILWLTFGYFLHNMWNFQIFLHVFLSFVLSFAVSAVLFYFTKSNRVPLFVFGSIFLFVFASMNIYLNYDLQSLWFTVFS